MSRESEFYGQFGTMSCSDVGDKPSFSDVDDKSSFSDVGGDPATFSDVGDGSSFDDEEEEAGKAGA